MDYDKLIARWRNLANRWENGEQLLLDGTVRIEDELRIGATAIETLRADLARVTAERDGAEKEITRLKAIMREKGIFIIPAQYPWKKPEWNW